MFLTVITRTYKRPEALAACVASLTAQAAGDMQHLLLVDDVGIGIAATYQEMSLRDWSDVEGEWVYVLDDDNVLADGALYELRRAAATGADMIIARAAMGVHGVLPRLALWGQTPALGEIDMGCVCLRRDLFVQAIRRAEARYEGDYYYIRAAYEMATQVEWMDKIIMRVQRISYGKAEQ